MAEYCPCCKQRIGGSTHPRICANCGQPITRHHKWRFRPDGRVEHRHCDNPEAYLPREDTTDE